MHFYLIQAKYSELLYGEYDEGSEDVHVPLFLIEETPETQNMASLIVAYLKRAQVIAYENKHLEHRASDLRMNYRSNYEKMNPYPSAPEQPNYKEYKVPPIPANLKVLSKEERETSSSFQAYVMACKYFNTQKDCLRAEYQGKWNTYNHQVKEWNAKFNEAYENFHPVVEVANLQYGEEFPMKYRAFIDKFDFSEHDYDFDFMRIELI